jgi:hypothetical protein
MVLSDCPENANCKGKGPYSYSRWVPMVSEEVYSFSEETFCGH